MTVPLMRRLVLASATVLVAIVAMLLLLQWRWSPPPPHPVGDALFDVPGLASGGLDVALLGETLVRPLFVPDRRPPAPDAAPTAEVEADPLAHVQVLGLFGSGSNGGAILLIDGKAQRIRHGEMAGPWTLQGVDGRSLEFSRDDGTHARLELVHLPQPDAPPPPPALEPPTAEAPVADGDAAADDAESARAASAAARAQARAARLRELQPPGPALQ